VRRNGYYEGKHGYYPSVTTITKSAGNASGLIHWAAKQGGYGAFVLKPQTVEEAGEAGMAYLSTESRRVQEFGSRVHEGIEKYLGRIDLDDTNWSEVEKMALQTFIQFYNGIKFKTVHIEKYICSDEFEFGGRVDLVSEINEEQCNLITPFLDRSSTPPVAGSIIVDYKTGSMYPRSQIVQLAAYRVGLKENTGRDCNGALLINIKREEPSKVVCHYFGKEELENAFIKGFMPAYDCWKFFDSPQWWQKQKENV
jgi:hypothetical protein